MPGRYVFKLTVADDQGLTGTDTVSVIVHPDPMLINLVELTFTTGVTVLTESDVESLQQKLVLLLGDHTHLVVRNLKTEQKTGEAVLVFYVEKVGSCPRNDFAVFLYILSAFFPHSKCPNKRQLCLAWTWNEC